MGDFIGTSSVATWGSLRDVVNNFDAPPLTVKIGDYNIEYPAGTKYMKTIEGNGLLRRASGVGGPEINFSESTAPIEDFFIAGGFSDPYPENMVGKTVQTSTSSFVLIIDAFDTGQAAGIDGTSPVTDMEWFEDIS